MLKSLIAGRENRQKRRQTGMLLLSRVSATKHRGTRSEKLGGSACFFHVHHQWHTDTNCETDLVKAHSMFLENRQSIQSCCCALRRHPSRLYCKSCRIRSTDLPSSERDRGSCRLSGKGETEKTKTAGEVPDGPVLVVKLLRVIMSDIEKQHQSSTSEHVNVNDTPAIIQA